MNSLYRGIDWSSVDAVGVDMDGTLYDEFEFIAQAYDNLARVIEKKYQVPAGQVVKFMRERWLVKGSSYNQIFRECGLHLLVPDVNRFEIECLNQYRRTTFSLALPSRSKAILEYSQMHWKLFLVTDGNERIQRQKFFSLGLDRFFGSRAAIFTASLSDRGPKPANLAYLELKKRRVLSDDDRVVFLGDRSVDAQFADNCGFEFVKVANMVPVN